MTIFTVEYLLKNARIITALLGFVVLVIGLNSHYQSSWVSLHENSEAVDMKAAKMHELCEIKYFYGNCPDVILEQFFVAVISINFIFSLLGLVSWYLWYRGAVEFHPLKWLDFGYHIVSSMFLIAAASVYIVSAVQIKEFSGGVDLPMVNFRTEEKFVAGGLTILQAILHIAVAILIGNCKRIRADTQPVSVDMTAIGNGIVNSGMNIQS